LPEELITLIEGIKSPVSLWEAIIAVVLSLIASIIVYFMYQLFYGSRNIGAGVHRTFIIGGPAITVLLMAIQTSIPLSLGLLGSLSIVRFRTPIKDPAEIGFLLLLIASSICVATSNYLIVGILIIVVFIALGIQRLTRDRFTLFGRGHLMISVDQPSFTGLEPGLTSFLNERLKGISLESMSTLENRVSLQYQYKRQAGFDWAAFTRDLNRLGGTAKIETFIG